jgi:hypothetical protein
LYVGELSPKSESKKFMAKGAIVNDYTTNRAQLIIKSNRDNKMEDSLELPSGDEVE